MVMGGALALYLATTLIVASITNSAVMGALWANATVFVAGLIWIRSRVTSQGPPVRSSSTTNPTIWLLIFAAVPATWFVAQTTAALLYSYVGSPSFDTQVQAITETPASLTLLLVLMFAPVGEEMLMRGLLYAELRNHVAPIWAALFSALIFALLHMNLVQIVLTLPLGLLLAAIYERTKNLVSVIVAHALFNALSVTMPASVITSLTSLPFVIAGLALFGLLLAQLYGKKTDFS
jgi:membrane protease YdiL (CAAX protease family)